MSKFEAYTYDQKNWNKNNTTQLDLYFILGIAELRWNFSSWFKDASDIYRFPVVSMVKIHWHVLLILFSTLCDKILEHFFYFL